jgi:hypothetical protein
MASSVPNYLRISSSFTHLVDITQSKSSSPSMSPRKTPSTLACIPKPRSRWAVLRDLLSTMVKGCKTHSLPFVPESVEVY